jgi:hypothetical protein
VFRKGAEVLLTRLAFWMIFMQQYFVCTLLSSHFCTRKYRQRSTILHAKIETLTDLSCWTKIAVMPRMSVRNPHGPEHVTNLFSPLIQKQPICNSDWFYYTWNWFHQSYNLLWLFCVQYQWKRMYQISMLSNPHQTKFAHDMVLCFQIIPQSPVWLMRP